MLQDSCSQTLDAAQAIREGRLLYSLDFNRDLAVIAEAVRDRALQCYSPSDSNRCLYVGPCVIGVLLPTEAREILDNAGTEEPSDDGLTMSSVALWSALDEGYLLCPDAQRQDWGDLQEAHDDAVMSLDVATGVGVEQRALAISKLEDLVVDLSLRYGPSERS